MSTATTPPRTVRGIGALRAAVGQELGVSSWHQVEQGDIDVFAQVTRDLFWIHTDTQRAARGPLGQTIAHGLYTLSLGPGLMGEIVRWEDLGLMQNYGYDRVRFTAPLPIGSRVRMRMTLEAVTAKPRGPLLRLGQVFEREDDTPVCVADAFLFFIVGATAEVG